MKRTVILLLLGTFLSAPAMGKTTTEYQTWLSAGIRTKLTRQVSLDASFQQKSNPTMTDLYQAFPKVALGYKALSYLRLKVGSRYAFVWDEDKKDRQLRFFQDMASSTPTLFWMKLGYRLRFQQTHSTQEETWSPKIRNRIALTVAVSDYFRPGLFYEHFLDLRESGSQMSADDRRGLSISSRLTRKHRLKLRFFQSTELNGDEDKERIVTLGYTYHL